jgi:hypothetical protein
MNVGKGRGDVIYCGTPIEQGSLACLVVAIGTSTSVVQLTGKLPHERSLEPLPGKPIQNARYVDRVEELHKVGLGYASMQGVHALTYRSVLSAEVCVGRDLQDRAAMRSAVLSVARVGSPAAVLSCADIVFFSPSSLRPFPAWQRPIFWQFLLGPYDSNSSLHHFRGNIDVVQRIIWQASMSTTLEAQLAEAHRRCAGSGTVRGPPLVKL